MSRVTEVYLLGRIIRSVTNRDVIESKGGNTMAYKITDACISCGACAAECPVEAISEGGSQFVIDADKCIDCGSCADACPVDAPKAD